MEPGGVFCFPVSEVLAQISKEALVCSCHPYQTLRVFSMGQVLGWFVILTWMENLQDLDIR